ncbi:MAG TPA: glycoside hydrolase family 2 TIM barrel-domain containing protein [Terriglobales bacterium]|nr:glycoside hydrolase family 2 TIM barrel-domain containing protein [Terriglobales bacterium]
MRGNSSAKQLDDSASIISLPHCVSALSWQNWDPAQWEDLWIYRKRFQLPAELSGLRVFLHFDRVMTGAEPSINHHKLPPHLGGYLPFQYEITDFLAPTDNVLDVVVDSRWSNVPPEGSPGGPSTIDYLEPGGIHGSVRLNAVPAIFIRDVFARPVHVLDETRAIDVTCSIDAAALASAELQIELRNSAGQVLSRTRKQVSIEKVGQTEVKLVLSRIGNISLWDIDSPQLYDVVCTLWIDGKPAHDYRVRIGFRDARFELDGFFLNGRRLQLFGLNRHELFPYVGAAMPARVMRRDAEILRKDFNCNIVRCSHYPQSEAFLDRCDELGLMVWEEVPGWQYIGDDTWKDLLVRDTKDMIVRDRNHPSIVIWGVRANESANDVELYGRTTSAAKSLDDSRPASGSMTPSSRKDWKERWHEDVFAFDDYHSAPDGTVGIEEPVEAVPYFLAEAVGQFNYERRKGFDNRYRRAGDVHLQQQQALWHAQAHDKAAANRRFCGVIAWCAFDYGSLMNAYQTVKCPGVADVFRIPKLGASFYLSQVDPKIRSVIQPSFYWDFGPQTPHGPGKRAAIFSNCDRLELSIGGKPHSTLYPDREGFPNLKYPPFVADLEIDGAGNPELRIDGFVAGRMVLSRKFSSDHSQDGFRLKSDDPELVGDGIDATRLAFGVVDKYGAERAFAGGSVRFEITGPGVIVGDNPFSLEASGGVGAVWIRTVPNARGDIRIEATHSTLGAARAQIRVQKQ